MSNGFRLFTVNSFVRSDNEENASNIPNVINNLCFCASQK